MANTVQPQCQNYLDACLTSIKKGGYYENGYHVLLVYDNCPEEFQKYFKEKFSGDFIAAISNVNPKNLNFCKNVNTGLRIAFQAAQSTGDIDAQFIILNMDTILPPHWHLDKVFGEGLSSPTPVDDPTVVLSKVGPDHKWEQKRHQVTRLGGFCMCLSYKLVEKIGVLDERFTASFEDDSLCADALLAGFPVELVDIKVHHELKDRTTPSNTGAYDEISLGVHLNIFRRKYSIPPTVPHENFNQWIVDNHVWVPERKNV